MKNLIVWEITSEDVIEKTGLLEFTIDTDDSDILFPMEVFFRGYRSYSGIKVKKVFNPNENTPVDFSSECIFLSEKYQVV